MQLQRVWVILELNVRPVVDDGARQTTAGVVVCNSTLATWIESLDRLPEGIVVDGVRAGGVRRIVDDAVHARGGQPVESVLRQVRHDDGSEIGIVVVQQLVLFAARQDDIRRLKERTEIMPDNEIHKNFIHFV